MKDRIAPRRYELDNAGHVFSSLMSSVSQPVFRFTAVLADPVVPEALQAAVSRTMGRFPYFDVRLRSGLFWHYLEEAGRTVVPEPDPVNPFAGSGIDGPLLRVRYGERRISVDMAHVLGDGYSAMVFLKTLLVQYFRELGGDARPTHGALSPEETPDPEETEDSYPRFCARRARPALRKRRAFVLEGRRFPDGGAVATTGLVATGVLREKARAQGVSVTEYLSGVLARSFLDLQERRAAGKPLPVRISLSTDLRRHCPSRTMRNFSGYATPTAGPDVALEPPEVLARSMRAQCRVLLSEEAQRSLVCRNVGFQRNPLVRALPLPVKRRILSGVYRWTGARNASVNLTNMGVVELPEGISDRVGHFETQGGNFLHSRLKCGVISYGDRMSVCFTRSVDVAGIEERFFEILVREGIPVETDIQVRSRCLPDNGSATRERTEGAFV